MTSIQGSSRLSPLSALLVLLVTAAGMLAIAATRSFRSGGAGVIAKDRRGMVRELAFPLLGGGEWRLSQQRGRVVAVNLWATWCPPCREETPALADLDRELRDAGFELIGVSLDSGADRAATVREFARRHGVRYLLAFPQPMSQMESGLDGIPTTLLFDREGRAAKVYVGTVREQVLRTDAETLLREP